MLRILTLLSAALALTTPLLARDTVGAGFGADSIQALTLQTSFASYDTLTNGNRVVFDGAVVWIEQANGTFVQTIAGTPTPGFPSFIQVDPTETFAILGESTTGAIYRVGLSGGVLPLATISLNFAFAFEPGAATGIVSAATCPSTCANGLYRLDLTSGTITLIAKVAGPSGPLAFSAAGDLHYITQSNEFPTPPGSLEILRWSASQLANGPYPMGAAQATVFTAGLDGGDSLAFDPEFGHLFVAVSPFGGTANVLEIDRFGTVVGSVASSLDYISNVEVFDAPGAGVLAAFQPAGARLQYRTTEFNQQTSQIVHISPRRPELSAVQHGDGTMTLSLSGTTPNTSCFVISSPLASYNPIESSFDLVSFQFWTGLPYQSNIRRVGNQITADANGDGSFTFSNPVSIQGTRVIQVLVRDASGTFRGSSTTVTN